MAAQPNSGSMEIPGFHRNRGPSIQVDVMTPEEFHVIDCWNNLHVRRSGPSGVAGVTFIPGYNSTFSRVAAELKR